MQFQTALLLANLGQLDGSRLKRARQPGWSATNGQLQAAQLPNYTNSTPATFASYWPITFTCQMKYPNRNNGEVYRFQVPKLSEYLRLLLSTNSANTPGCKYCKFAYNCYFDKHKLTLVTSQTADFPSFKSGIQPEKRLKTDIWIWFAQL